MSNRVTKEVCLLCLKAKEAAEYIGTSRQLLWDLKKAKAIPFFQLGPSSDIFYPKVGLDLWIKNNRPYDFKKRSQARNLTNRKKGLSDE